MTFSNRIKSRMKQVKLTQEQLAEIIGVSQASVQKYVSGKTQATNKILDLARALECDPEWLATGDERIETQVLSVQDSKAEYSLTSSEIELLKVEGACGGGSTIDCEPLHTARLIKEDSWFKKYKVRPKDTFAVYAKGDSMEMFIVEGDIVIFNKTKTKPVSGQIFLIRHPDGLKIKSLRQDITGTWLAESLNDKYPTETIPKEMIDQIGILGEFIYRQGG
jgi:phage repressor protein C with HTH and peptisase S24 domain